MHGRVAAFALSIMASALPLLAAGTAAAQSASDPSGQEVVVTAARVPQKLPDTLPNTTVITAADIAASSAVDVPDLLRQFVSFNVAQTGLLGAQASVFVRGANSNQVLVLVDGAPLSRADFGSAPWELVPLAQVDHVEVVRGNMSSLYGAQAVGGVVQIFTRHDPVSSVSFGVATRGSMQGSASVGQRFGDAAAPLDINASVSGVHTDGVSARDPRLDPSVDPDRDPATQAGATFSIGKTWAPGQRTTLSAIQSNTTSHYDGYDGPTVDDVLKTSLDNVMLRSQHALTSSLDLDLHAGEDLIHYTDPTAFTTLGTARTRLLGIGADWTIVDGQRVQVGYENQDEHYGDSSIPETTRRTNSIRAGYLGTFASALEVQANVRHDDASDYGSANTGLLSLGWRVSPDLKLVAQASNAFSAPSFSDIQYERAPLKPERSRDFEAGVHWQHGAWLARATLFSQRQHDLIGFTADSVTVNIDRSSDRGVELAVEGDTGYGKVGLDATFQDPRDDDAHAQLLRRARTVVAANYRVPVAGWETGVWLHYTGARPDYAPVTFEVVQAKARTVLALTATRPLSQNWSLGLKADNLTGSRTPEVLGYTPPPPTLLVTLTGRWQ